MNLFDLKGKVAVVTGCNTGLGQGMALALAEAGCKVVGVNRVEVAETTAKMKELNAEFVNYEFDLGDHKGITALVEKIVAENGRIDILVNNAGIIRREDALDYSESDWDDVININLKTVFLLSQAVARHFVKAGIKGKIISIASMLSFQGGIRVPAYTASKSAVMGLTKALANEWAKYGICVNAIAPGYMATNNTAALRADAERNQAILERIPAQRWGLPSDLAGPIIFLASAASDYVNGYTIAVDGGWLAR